MTAVCVRCGAHKPAYDRVCPGCGHRPEGDGLLVAWLLSDAYLSPDQLERAAANVRRGDAVRPSDRMIDTARRALGTHADTDTGLTPTQAAALFLTSALLTPFVGFVLWARWFAERPRSARQALLLSFPVGVLFAVWVGSESLAELGITVGWSAPPT